MLLIDIEHRSFEASCARAAELGGADLAFFSPPYPTAKPGAKGAAGAPTRDYGGDAPKHFLWPDYQRLGDCVFQALRPGGFCIVIIDGPVRVVDKAKGSERSLIAFRLAIDWAERVGFRYVEHEAYVRLGMAGRFGLRRRSGWEPMHVFQRPGGVGFFDVWAVALKSLHAGKRNSNAAHNGWNGTKKSGRRGQSSYIQSTERAITTAVQASAHGLSLNNDVYGCGHPAPFSPWTAMVQVLSYSPPNGLVLDPFVGSGTTAIACAKHGRSFVGGDLGARERDGARWADVARERAERAAGQEPMRAVVPAVATAPTAAQVGLFDARS